jgi:molybdopterin molybdotransferase
MLGRSQLLRPRFPVKLGIDFKKVAGLHFFARGIIVPDSNATLIARPTGAQGSNLFTSIQRANAIIHLPTHWENATEGSIAEAEWASF